VSTSGIKIDLEPRQKGILRVDLPSEWRNLDILRIRINDLYGRHINTFTWPVQYPDLIAGSLIKSLSNTRPVSDEKENTLIITAGPLVYTLNKNNGALQRVEKNGKVVPLSSRPDFVNGKKPVREVTCNYLGNDLLIETQWDNGDWFKWIIRGDGLLDFETAYEPSNSSLFSGISFNFPETKIKGMKWLGNGPYRVYKNRMKGTEYGFWEKSYNNTVTGESEFIYPEFKGYYSNIYWVKIFGKETPDFTIYIHNKDIFLKMLTPAAPKIPAKTIIEYPEGDISFLHGINAIGTKFSEPALSGPQSLPTPFDPVKITGRKLNMKLTFDFRDKK